MIFNHMQERTAVADALMPSRPAVLDVGRWRVQ
jgi:hypothetical protein